MPYDLIGHSAVRRYVMGEASQERHAPEDEVAAMKAVVRELLRYISAHRTSSSSFVHQGA